VTAAAIFLLYPATILAESRGGLESVFTACAIFLLIAVYRALDSYRYRDFLIVGALFGLCLLIKSTLAFALPLLFLWLLVAKVPRPGLTKLVALFAAASAVATLALSPWIIRNYSVSGKFIPTITGGGTAAFQGLWVVKHGGSGKPHMELLNEAIEEEDRIAREMGFSFKPGFFPQFYSVDDEIRFYDELGRRTRAELMASPQLALKFVGYNAIGFWIQGRTPRATVFNAILVIPFVAVCVIGLVIAVRRRFPVAPTILLIAAYFAPHVPILGVARYHTPIVPFLAIFAAVALVNMFSRSTGVFR
jgi:4-amino-4-deoxy-L-arabinose transferase-like glycosyltransferase